jgi:hypothetical protein
VIPKTPVADKLYSTGSAQWHGSLVAHLARLRRQAREYVLLLLLLLLQLGLVVQLEKPVV